LPHRPHRGLRKHLPALRTVGPSDNPDFAQWLVEEGIESMSLNPDPVIETWQKLAKM
jgi:phosphoenolpyruvate synthase/pyruvate phosphate dikinase